MIYKLFCYNKFCIEIYSKEFSPYSNELFCYNKFCIEIALLNLPDYAVDYFAITNFVLKITLFPLFRAFCVAINVYALLSSIFCP